MSEERRNRNMKNFLYKWKNGLHSVYLVIISILILLSLNACKSEKEKNLDEEINQRKKQVPQFNNQVPDQPQITPLVNLSPAQEKIKEEAVNVIKRNMRATELKDIDGVLSTIHEDSPQLQATKNGMEFIFKSYDLKFKLLEADAISITNNEVQIYYKQRTEGSNFETRETAGIHILKKSKNGKWKIYKTEYL